MSPLSRAERAGAVYLDLQRVARQTGRTTQDVLTMYVVERWLARLAASAYADDFVLKGGMLLAAFGQRRTTADADTWAQNLSREAATVGARVAEIAAIPEPADGVVFDPATVRTKVIREDSTYTGVRVTMTAHLATARLTFKLDVSFGDPITPAPQDVEIPSLLPGTPPVRMRGYPIATVLAEKIVTAVDLGDTNTRVRDYADVYTLIHTQSIDQAAVRDALEATAAFRDVTVRPLSEAIGDIVALRAGDYVTHRANLGATTRLPASFAEVVAAVVAFADPLLT